MVIRVFQLAKGDRYSPPPKPEHDCPVCGKKAGYWCVDFLGDDGWQHADRPESSWENK